MNICVERKTEGLGFPEAMSVLLNGGQIAREGWNGKGMYLWLVGPSIPIEDGGIDLEPCVVLFNTRGLHQPGWVSSQGDMMACDWTVVEFEEVSE